MEDLRYPNVASGRIFKDWSYDFQDNGSVELWGRLYVPPGYDPADTTKKYPLVVFYHGSGESGTNNSGQLVRWPAKVAEAAQQKGFFFYLPQTNIGWNRPGLITQDQSALQMANLLRAYRIDPEKIYLTGFSMGGNAVWSLSGMHAGAIAGAFPVEPVRGGLADSNAALLAGKPVWVFYNRADNQTPYLYSEARGRVNQLRVAGGKTPWVFPAKSDTTTDYFNEENGLRYSEPPAGGHTTEWAYSKPELYTWLLAQSNTTGWLNDGETVKVDFGSQRVPTTTALDTPIKDTGTTDPNVYNVETDLRPDGSGTNWNSTASGYGTNFNAAIPFAKTTTGRSTFVSVHVLDKFAGDYNQTGGSATVYDANIGKDGWVTTSGGVGKILVRGLTPLAAYRVEIFASGTNSNTAYRHTLYQIGSRQEILTVYNNVSDKAAFPVVTADANGEFILEVSGAAAASSVYGLIGTLEITAIEPPPAPVAGGAVSRLKHGTGVDWDIVLPLTGPSGVESRRKTAAGNFNIVFTFDKPVVSASAQLTGVGQVDGAPAVSGNTVAVALTGVSNAQTVTLQLSNVVPVDGGPGGSATVTFRVLQGDVTGDGAVTAADADKVKSLLCPTLGAATFSCDVDANGLLNTGDVLLTKSKLNTTAP